MCNVNATKTDSALRAARRRAGLSMESSRGAGRDILGRSSTCPRRPRTSCATAPRTPLRRCWACRGEYGCDPAWCTRAWGSPLLRPAGAGPRRRRRPARRPGSPRRRARRREAHLPPGIRGLASRTRRRAGGCDGRTRSPTGATAPASPCSCRGRSSTCRAGLMVHILRQGSGRGPGGSSVRQGRADYPRHAPRDPGDEQRGRDGARSTGTLSEARALMVSSVLYAAQARTRFIVGLDRLDADLNLYDG